MVVDMISFTGAYDNVSSELHDFTDSDIIYCDLSQVSYVLYFNVLTLYMTLLGRY